MKISGFNLPHLGNFTKAEFDALADYMIERGMTGMTMRYYGGNESKYYTPTDDMWAFLERINAKLIFVTPFSEEDAPTEYLNEPYLFAPPTIWQGWREWAFYTFNKNGYYKQRAKDDLEYIKSFNNPNTIVSLPLKVTQNGAFREYAKVFLQSGYDFEIDLHVFGGDPVRFYNNLQWYKENAQGRKIHFLEFFGTTNTRGDQRPEKNSDGHAWLHNELLRIMDIVLGDQVGEVLIFTLAANEEALDRWHPDSQPFLHTFEIRNGQVVNTIPNVMSFD